MYQSLPLEQIRQKIDSLDNQIHDLLMERADLIMAISEEKKKAGIQIVQPAREARMIRRLMARHHGPLPEETIVRIWRELVSSVSLLQTGLSVAVYAPDDIPEYWDMARDYFGTVLPMQRVSTPLDALNLVKNGVTTFAVLPMPKEKDASASWWQIMITRNPDYEGMSVIQRLPYGEKTHFDFKRHPALVVAKAGFGDSGDDHSLIAIHAPSLSRSKLLEILQDKKITGKTLYGENDIFLLDVRRHTQPDDEFLKTLSLATGAEAMLLGGYPAQLTYHDNEKEKS